MDRKAFNFYKSYYDVAVELPDEDRNEFVWAIVSAQFTGKLIEPKSKLARLMFLGQKHSLLKQLEGFKAATGAPREAPHEGPYEAPSQQVQEQGEVQEQVQEKEEGKYSATTKVATIEERQKKLMEKMAIHLPEYGKEMLREFFDYWTEMNEGGKKMRFEMQKVFDISRRLKTWSRNNNFKRNGSGIEKITNDQQKRNALIAAKFAAKTAEPS